MMRKGYTYTAESCTANYNRWHQTNYTPYELLHELYVKRLYSAERIGRKLYVCKPVIYRFLSEVGIKTRPKGKPYRLERSTYYKRLMAIPKARLKHMRKSDILKHVKCSDSYLSQLMRRLGIEYDRSAGKRLNEKPTYKPSLNRGLGELIDSRC